MQNANYMFLRIWLLLMFAVRMEAQLFLQYDLAGNLIAQTNSRATQPPPLQLTPSYQVAEPNGHVSISMPVTGPGTILWP